VAVAAGGALIGRELGADAREPSSDIPNAMSP
jgi:hypothetical protein